MEAREDRAMRALLVPCVAAAAIVMAAAPGIVSSAAAAGGGVAPQTVYGKDDRREVLELRGARAAVADSLVALVLDFDLDDNGDGTSHLFGPMLREIGL